MTTLSTDCSQPDLAGLVSDRLRSWASPFRGCSALAVERHSCHSAPTWWLETCPPDRTISTVKRQIPPPLGFTPQVCPSPDYGCYPVTGLAPLLGFSSLRFVLRPAGLVLRQASARWLGPRAVTRKRRLPLGVSIADRPFRSVTRRPKPANALPCDKVRTETPR